MPEITQQCCKKNQILLVYPQKKIHFMGAGTSLACSYDHENGGITPVDWHLSWSFAKKNLQTH